MDDLEQDLAAQTGGVGLGLDAHAMGPAPGHLPPGEDLARVEARVRPGEGRGAAAGS